jgi:eukaryotic-like serine/threonine-protein kinase
MKNKLIYVIITLALSIGLSACAGGRLQASGWPGIAADDETAYVAFNQQVYAINLSNGVEKWHYPNEVDNTITFYAPPALTDDGQVIVGGYNNIIYSLDAQNGQLNWTFEEATDRFVGSALVAGEMIFAPSSDDNLYALNLNGQPAWAKPFSTENSNWSKPTAESDCECVYLASMDHSIYAIDPSNGQQIWQSESLGGATVGTPAVSDNGQLYIGTFLDELVAIEASSGTILWRFSTEGWVWASPVLDGDVVYFGDIEGNFYAVDSQTGSQLWTTQSNGAIVGRPLVTEDGVYFTTEAGSLYALTLEGGTRWTKDFEATLHSGPVATGDLILITTDEGGLVLLGLDANGSQKWQFSPSEEK